LSWTSSIRALNLLDVFVRLGMPGVPVELPRVTGGDIAGVASLGVCTANRFACEACRDNAGRPTCGNS
jgi:hypothetical protein